MAETGWIGLAEAVQELRAQLMLAMEAGAGEPIRFELGPVEVEFALTLQRDGGGNIGVNVAVASVGAKGSMQRESFHQLRLTLLPKDVATGRAPEVAGWVDQIPSR